MCKETIPSKKQLAKKKREKKEKEEKEEKEKYEKKKTKVLVKPSCWNRTIEIASKKQEIAELDGRRLIGCYHCGYK